MYVFLKKKPIKNKVSKSPEASRFYLVNKDFFVPNNGLTNVNIF